MPSGALVELGLEAPRVLSKGRRAGAPNAPAKALCLVRRLSPWLSSKQNGLKTHRKAAMKLVRLHRRDFLHKTAAC